MKRCIGMWTNELSSTKQAKVAELILDGNHIEFYQRGFEEVFPCAFLGDDGEHKYKVFVNGRSKAGHNQSLTSAISYRVFYALQQNCPFPVGLDIKGIIECSFIIPELIDWLNIQTVEFDINENEEMIAKERKLPPIVLKEENPHIEIRFDSESFANSISNDMHTTIILKSQPRVYIQYDDTSGISGVNDDIRTIMQFWGLMIGCVSDVNDIRLTIKGQEQKCWLFINRDYSYNLFSRIVVDKPRTDLKRIITVISDYFTNWYEFCQEEKFGLIRLMYFSTNDRKDKFIEDILVQYVRILEGYHLRISPDEEEAEKIKLAITDTENDIKKLIFSEDGKPLFTAALSKAVPEWKFSSKHANDVARWIACGYLERISLSQRIKLLDDMFYNVIGNNAKSIRELARKKKQPPEITVEQAAELFYKEIADTRNYFAHYKTDDRNALEYSQMYDTINVLKALLIMIFLSRMGVEHETIRKIMMWDRELNFQTMYLRREGESPDDEWIEEAADEQNLKANEVL